MSSKALAEGMFHRRTLRFSCLLSLVILCQRSAALSVDKYPNTTQSPAFDVNTTGAFPTGCWFPISGNYGRLPRLIFYCVILFGLLASQFEWLIAGALAAALTYSGTAAIHACLFVWIGPHVGDLDSFAHIAILSTSCLITVPLINWSSTLRHLGSREDQESDARTIIIFWAFLVFVGLISTLGLTWTSTGFMYSNDVNSTIITCTPPSGTLDFSVGQSPFANASFFATGEWIETNRCDDPCQGSLYYPVPIFRKQTDIQIMSMKEIRATNSDLYLDSHNFISSYIIIAPMLGAVIISLGFSAVCFGRKNPRQCRQVIYHFLSRLGRRRRAVSPRWQRRIAKYLAITAYLWAVICSILCVVLFVLNIVAMETLLTIFPQSESASHVGAWSPWVTTGLVLLAGLIAKFHATMTQSVSMFVRRAWGRGNAALRRGKGFRRARQGERQKGKENINLSQPSQHVGKQSNDSDGSKVSVRSVFSKILTGLRAVREEWVLLKEFWQDPDSAG